MFALNLNMCINYVQKHGIKIDIKKDKDMKMKSQLKVLNIKSNNNTEFMYKIYVHLKSYLYSIQL